MKFPTFLTFLAQLAATQACLTDIERQGGHIIDLKAHSARGVINRRQANIGTVPVATGDRFQNGIIAPRGLGSNPNATFDSILNIGEIKSAVLGLAKRYGKDKVEYFELPHKTYENRTMYGAKIGGNGKKGNRGYKVLLESGIHSRERGGPDHLIYFIADLLQAAKENKGLVYGGMSYSAALVQSALAQGIIIIPVVNPDGLAFDQATDSCWRKNRNPARAIDGEPSSIGVDLNRNFAPVWNFTQAFAPGIDPSSDDPKSEIYHGTGPLSEPETKNVDWTLDQFPDLGWFLDLHSPATLVLYGWCHDSNQALDRSQSWQNATFDGKRGVVPDKPGFEYKEFLEQKDWDALTLAAARVAGGMTDSTGRFYRALQAPHLYPSSGCSADQGLIRAALDPKKKKVYGIGVEFGMWNEEVECKFYPTEETHRLNMIESSTAFMELLLTAARLG
ncbi:putative peptidase [Triangularia verruculosa]|uniref:Peptidase n=1 Tax=Triangularia verruculosa TaxID=2587418 RepID=A0AAN7B1C0_9PEZI|nr:putative peptidase [Triangularia verruculosa]